MSKKRKPSYFDDDYDEKVSSKQAFDIKSFVQVIAYYIIVFIKWLCDFAVSFRLKHPIDEIVKSNRKRRRLNFLLTLASIGIFAIMIFAVLFSVNNENKKIAKFNADAGAVCADLISQYGTPNYENLYSEYGVAGYRMTGLCYARELDFDNDGTSELFVCYSDNGTYQAEVWGYDGGEFIQLFHCKARQKRNVNDDAWVTLYYHNNKYYLGVHDEKDSSKVTLFGLKGDEFVNKYEATYDEQAELFVVRKKVDYTSFERIKLSVLREEKASVILDTVSTTIDGFKMDTTDAENKKKTNRKQAYAEIVKKYEAKFGAPTVRTDDEGAYIDGLAVVKLIDFDNDGSNELLVSYRKKGLSRDEDNEGNYVSVTQYKYQTEIYSFDGKNAKLVFEKEDACQKNIDSWDRFFIIQNDGDKKNICFNNYSSRENGHIVTATSTILSFNGKEFEPSYKSKYVTDYGYKEYYIDDEQVWTRQFEEDGYVVPFFDESSIYSSTEFDVFYVQKAGANASTIQPQLDETLSTIDKLIK